MSDSICLSRQTKCTRRTKAQMEALCDALEAILEQEHPMTVRQVFYQAVNAKLIAKTEAEYSGVIVRLLVRMRESGRIPFSWIADNTRWMRRSHMFYGVEHALQHMARIYRRNFWDDADDYVEVWLEKEALAGVVIEATDPWCVPLMVNRGYSSVSFLHSSAMAMRDIGKRIHIYYLGDFDPSGRDIARNTEKRLRQFAPNADIHFALIAVTPEQIKRFHLPTRPTKRTDTRAKNWQGESVEVDALPSSYLKQLVEERILSHLDQDRVNAMKRVEKMERETILNLSWDVGRDDDDNDEDQE